MTPDFRGNKYTVRQTILVSEIFTDKDYDWNKIKFGTVPKSAHSLSQVQARAAILIHEMMHMESGGHQSTGLNVSDENLNTGIVAYCF